MATPVYPAQPPTGTGTNSPTSSPSSTDVGLLSYILAAVVIIIPLYIMDVQGEKKWQYPYMIVVVLGIILVNASSVERFLSSLEK